MSTSPQPKIKTVYPDVRLTANEWFQYVYGELNKAVYGKTLERTKNN